MTKRGWLGSVFSSQLWWYTRAWFACNAKQNRRKIEGWDAVERKPSEHYTGSYLTYRIDHLNSIPLLYMIYRTYVLHCQHRPLGATAHIGLALCADGINKKWDRPLTGMTFWGRGNAYKMVESDYNTLGSAVPSAASKERLISCFFHGAA